MLIGFCRVHVGLIDHFSALTLIIFWFKAVEIYIVNFRVFYLINLCFCDFFFYYVCVLFSLFIILHTHMHPQSFCFLFYLMDVLNYYMIIYMFKNK